eukprot:scaffold57409_cov63-Phaeocystis_antarctica.AAC.3
MPLCRGCICPTKCICMPTSCAAALAGASAALTGAVTLTDKLASRLVFLPLPSLREASPRQRAWMTVADISFSRPETSFIEPPCAALGRCTFADVISHARCV